jgi:hypothetical protein
MEKTKELIGQNSDWRKTFQKELPKYAPKASLKRNVKLLLFMLHTTCESDNNISDMRTFSYWN